MNLIKLNSVNCRKALHATDVATAGRAARQARKMTVPKEFSFGSTPRTTPRSSRLDTNSDSEALHATISRTPQQARKKSVSKESCDGSLPPTPRTCISSAPPTPRLETASDGEDPNWSRSLRRAGTKTCTRTTTPRKQWRPQLTVPKGPELHTKGRASSSGRASLGCRSQDELDVSSKLGAARKKIVSSASAGRVDVPEKRRLGGPPTSARAKHVEASEQALGATMPRSGGNVRPSDDPAMEKCSVPTCGAGASAQERAQHARLLAKQKKR